MIRFVIKADSSEGRAAVTQVTDALKTMGKTAQDETSRGTSALSGFDKAMGSLKTVAAGMGLAFGAMELGRIIKSYADEAMGFQREWARVSVILRDTPTAQVEALKRQVTDMAPEFGTVKDKATALYETISAGITDPVKAMEFMRQAAIAASGGFTDMKTTVSAGTTVMAAWADSGITARRTFDVLAKMVDIGKPTFGEFASVIGQGASMASNAGVSFEEYAAAMASFSIVAGSAGESMTGVRQLIKAIVAPTKEAAETAAQLGIQWNGAALKSMHLTGVMEQLSGRTDVTTEQLHKLTGRMEAGNAASYFMSKSGLASLKSALDAVVGSSEGAGASLASHEARMKTFAGQWEALGNSLVNIASRVGDAMVPALAGFVEALRGGLPPLNALTTAVGVFALALLAVNFTSIVGSVAALALYGIPSLISVLGTAVGSMSAFGIAGAAAGAWMAGWKIGTWLREATGLGDWLDGMVQKLGLFTHTLDNTKNWNKEQGNLGKTSDALMKAHPELTTEILQAGDDAGKLAAIINRLAAAHTAAAKATGTHTGALKTLTPEQEKLKTDLDKTLHPLNDLVAQYQQFHDVGMTLHQFVALHADDIVNAAEAQRKLGVAIPPSSLAMLELAVATRRANETFDDTLLKVPDAGAAIRQLGIDAAAAKADLDKSLDSLTTERFGDEFHNPQPGVRDTLNSYVTSSADIERNWKQTNDLMNGTTKKAAAEREKDWKHSLKQMSTVATDFGRDLADIIMGKGTVLDAFKSLAKGMLRTLIEGFFSPVQKLFQNFAGQLMGLFSGKGFNLGSIFSGLSLPGFGGAGLGAAGNGISVTNMAGGTMSGLPSLGGGTAAAGGGSGIGGAAGIGATGAYTAGIGAGIGAFWGIDKLSGGGFMGKASGAAAGVATTAGIAALLGHGAMLSFLGPWGMAALAAVAAIGPLINAFNGKNSYEAGSPEVARDFGGVQVGKKGVQDWFDKLGLSESEAYPIRKDLFSSPKGITEFLWPLAQAQGKTDDFLKSLEHVATAWGTFDFRTPFEKGLKTGDFAELNAAFEKAWGPEALSHLGKFQDEWKAVGTAVDKTTDAMGRNAEAVAADLTAFDGLVEKFKQTAILTPELEAMIMKFGGSLRAFNDAAALPGLQEMQSGFDSIRQSLEQVLPNAFQEFQRTGVVSDELREKILSQGGDPAAFEKFGNLKHKSDSLDKLVSDFKSTGVASPELIAILKQFAPGFKEGDRLTSKSIDAFAASAHTNLDAALTAAGKDLKTQLDKINDTLQSAIDRLTQNLTWAIENLVAAIQGKPLPHDFKTEGRTDTTKPGTGTSTSSGTDTGRGGRGRGNPPPEGQGAPGVTIVFNGDVYGTDSFEEHVTRAVTSSYRRGGLDFIGGRR